MMPRLLLLSLVALSSAAASPLTDAQRQMANGHAADALTALRPLFAAEPANARLRYNYALAAYAAGQNSATLAALADAGDGEDEDLRARRLLLFGNALARHAEELASNNPEGALNEFIRAAAAYRQSAAFASATKPLAEANTAIVTHATMETLTALATHAIADADREARRAPEDGITGWLQAHQWLVRAREFARSEADQREIDTRLQTLATRITDATGTAIQTRLRQAARLLTTAPERAVALHEEALALLERVEKALGDSTRVAGERPTIRSGLRVARLTLARRLADDGRSLVHSAPAPAADTLGKAINLAETVLQENPGDTEAESLRTRARIDQRLAHEANGDQLVAQAALEPDTAVNARLERLKPALAAYEKAQRLAGTEATAIKITTTQHALADLFYRDASAALAQCRTLVAAETWEDAAAAAEKAIAGFRLSLRHAPTHEAAQKGLTEATELMEEIRRRLGIKLRQNENPDAEALKDPRKIENPPSDRALKLLDYRNSAAAKGPQLLQAPENRPARDW